MNFKDTLRKALTPELMGQIEDAVGDDFEWGGDMVPRSRLNKVISQRDEARAKLTGDHTQSSAKDDDDDDPSSHEGNKGQAVTPEDLKKALEELSKKKDDEMSDLKKQYAVSEKLREQGVLDPKLVWDANLLDKSKIVIDDSGNMTGLDDQLKSLKEAKGFLFGEGGTPEGTGRHGGDSFAAVKSKEDFLKLDSATQMKFKEANPTAFKSFMTV